MATSNTPYHHGDLPAALVRAAIELLEENGELSLRAAARRAGVSTAAPYRHFADREALVSAVAAVGYRELAAALAAANPAPKTAKDFSDIAIAYVQFALARPGLFRAMFSEPCDPTSPERVAATEAIHEYVRSIVREAFPDADVEALATAMWSIVHGLAFLFLHGKFDADAPGEPAATVSAAVRSVLGPAVRPRSRRTARSAVRSHS
ncbi:TetR/AcrR family transcriptional regulator [Nocardia cyriacigeorgica]|uniref:TetR/AcrR family transcriptional regulator n=1 Tax=Nocardia cyriacigeorgica TaxID=135487 RepID=UPI001893768C|nr:TetR/AcrR family transcriptional regulator [Nocardia cyriacigeorgica]MBF6454981.1 TetR/AcrR family transcriptional regulator [Nocardia cyriacigeorgica]MBF6480926.1 TetR/AcrR family transcriptional regulator [Nocardia cyriacigeorgica]MBF6552876.1 TetR/AcrR family transcriptional regulator [Nocardia cyriacigeorgica]